ncbi:hypothetical protein ACWKW1_12280 [Brevibacillus parabrevis]
MPSCSETPCAKTKSHLQAQKELRAAFSLPHKARVRRLPDQASRHKDSLR